MILQFPKRGLDRALPSSPPARGAAAAHGSSREPHTEFSAGATSAYAGAERRLSIRLEGYWRSLRRCARGPFFEDFWPSRSPVPWTNCFLAYVRDRDAEPIFDHVGSSIIALFKPDRTNLPDEEWLRDAIASHLGSLTDALAAAMPIRNQGRLERQHDIAALYRSVLLPFVDLMRQPAYVLGAVTYRLQDPSAAREGRGLLFGG